MSQNCRESRSTCMKVSKFSLSWIYGEPSEVRRRKIRVAMVILKGRKASRWNQGKLLILQICQARRAGRKHNIEARYIFSNKVVRWRKWRQGAREPYQCLIIAAYFISVIVWLTAFALYDPMFSSLLIPIAVRTRRTRTSQLYQRTVTSQARL